MNKAEQNKLKIKAQVSLGPKGGWNSGKVFVDTIGQEIQIRIWMSGRGRDNPIYLTLGKREALLLSERLISRTRMLDSGTRGRAK